MLKERFRKVRFHFTTTRLIQSSPTQLARRLRHPRGHRGRRDSRTVHKLLRHTLRPRKPATRHLTEGLHRVFADICRRCARVV